MLNSPTLDKLHTLRLTAMAATWQEQQRSAEAQALAFDDRLGLLVDAEFVARDNKRLTRHLKAAKLRISQASIEGLETAAVRGLEKAVVRQLASCQWIDDHLNVVITGATGVGKTYVACALAHQACRRGNRAIYRRAPRLFDELALSRADGSYPRLLQKLARVDVLVIDDWGLAAPRDADRRDLLEILEDRYGSRSTIMTSQLPPDAWHDHLADPTLADAICDRILHNAHRVALKGPSRRKEKSEIKP
jgi:DNA replication protein DnaC